MIYNPLLTLEKINENKKLLRKNIFNEIQKALNETGIRVTPVAKQEIEEKINLFVFDTYVNPCRYRHHLNIKDHKDNPEDM